MNVDLDAARRFLDLLDEGADIFLFQTATDDPEIKKQYDPKNNPDPLARIYPLPRDELGVIADLNVRGAAIWVMINEGTKRKNDAITRVRAVFGDCDGTPLQAIIGCDPEPHIIVETSPGHYHPYWLVDGLPLDQFTNVQRAIKQSFNGDAVVDLARVMRLPGFLHQKNPAAPFLARIVHTNERLPYSADEILAAFPAPHKEAPAARADDAAGSGALPYTQRWTKETALPHVAAASREGASLPLGPMIAECLKEAPFRKIWDRTDKDKLAKFIKQDGSADHSKWDLSLANIVLSVMQPDWRTLVALLKEYRDRWAGDAKSQRDDYWAFTIARASNQEYYPSVKAERRVVNVAANAEREAEFAEQREQKKQEREREREEQERQANSPDNIEHIRAWIIDRYEIAFRDGQEAFSAYLGEYIKESALISDRDILNKFKCKDRQRVFTKWRQPAFGEVLLGLKEEHECDSMAGRDAFIREMVRFLTSTITSRDGGAPEAKPVLAWLGPIAAKMPGHWQRLKRRDIFGMWTAKGGLSVAFLPSAIYQLCGRSLRISKHSKEKLIALVEKYGLGGGSTVEGLVGGTRERMIVLDAGWIRRVIVIEEVIEFNDATGGSEGADL